LNALGIVSPVVRQRSAHGEAEERNYVRCSLEGAGGHPSVVFPGLYGFHLAALL